MSTIEAAEPTDGAPVSARYTAREACEVEVYATSLDYGQHKAIVSLAHVARHDSAPHGLIPVPGAPLPGLWMREPSRSAITWGATYTPLSAHEAQELVNDPAEHVGLWPSYLSLTSNGARGHVVAVRERAWKQYQPIPTDSHWTASEVRS